MSRIINLKTKKEIWEKHQENNKNAKNKEHSESLQAQEAAEKISNGQSQHFFEWSAFEFVKHKKTADWFIVGGIFTAILLLIAIFTKNFIFAVIIILSAFLIYIWAQKEPKKHKFKISPKGIAIGKTLYNFDNLKSFWIFYDPPGIKYLSIESKKILMPRIVIPLGNANPNKIREALIDFLPEEEQEESLIDILGRHLRY